MLGLRSVEVRRDRRAPAEPAIQRASDADAVRVRAEALSLKPVRGERAIRQLDEGGEVRPVDEEVLASRDRSGLGPGGVAEHRHRKRVA